MLAADDSEEGGVTTLVKLDKDPTTPTTPDGSDEGAHGGQEDPVVVITFCTRGNTFLSLVQAWFACLVRLLYQFNVMIWHSFSYSVFHTNGGEL